MDATRSADGKWIVLKNGQRIGPVYENAESAEASADGLRKLCESQGDAAVRIEVKQLIMG